MASQMRTLSKKSYKVSIFLIITLVLAALATSCASTATPQVVSKLQPTATHTAVPPVKNEDKPSTDDASQGTTADILDMVWYWERFADTAGMNDIAVGDPGRYTLTLLPDGAFQLKVDCNRASGAYTVSGSQITLQVGPITRAFCGEDSLHDQYLRMLGDVATYVMDGDQLVLNLKMDAGNMIFGRELQSPLASTTWSWAKASDGTAVSDSDKYVITFNEDSTLAIQADCNRASGGYTLDGDALTIQIGPMTMAECAPGSLYNQFVRELGSVRGYALVDGELVLKMDSGEITLAVYTPLAGTTWQWVETSDGMAVSDSDKYIITFNDDGSLAIKADCNRAFGGYETVGDALTFGALGMTRAMCRPGSLDQQFVQELGSVRGHALIDGELVLKVDGGEMTLAAYTPLAGATWQWTETSDGTAVTDPDRYTIAFNEDGTVAIKADCNRASGGYALDGDALTIQIGPMTMAECAPGSLYNEFVSQLGTVKSYTLGADGALILRLAAGAQIRLVQGPTS